ncbi:hypothetical protein GCM10010961_05610 [Pseudodonghicola xiamenensis]|uniref:Uncharacterized protein n=1 Tax=Pseudodonghicola xiamenensis TaxID=337702 RepID=A0A8J3MB55_9RHOB|nr:hypothetical protein GCM10010961_05610 [Pseudodonghicola xiamenensis]
MVEPRDSCGATGGRERGANTSLRPEGRILGALRSRGNDEGTRVKVIERLIEVYLGSGGGEWAR